MRGMIVIIVKQRNEVACMEVWLEDWVLGRMEFTASRRGVGMVCCGVAKVVFFKMFIRGVC